MALSARDLLLQAQEGLLEISEISPVLLKLRLLASRLGSDLLEEWVKYETEGYPKEVEVPDYRKIGVHYTGTFSHPTQILRNVPIPPYLVERLAGKQWVLHQMREPLAEIEHLIQRSYQDTESSLTLGGSANLISLLQGKVYRGMACHDVTGTISENALVNIQSVVRSRIMDLTIQIEAAIGATSDGSDPANSPDTYNAITDSVIYGSVNIGSNISGNVTQTVAAKDPESLTAALEELGLGAKNSAALAHIMAGEKPSGNSSLGAKAKAWIARNVDDVARPVIVKLLSDLARSFYGS